MIFILQTNDLYEKSRSPKALAQVDVDWGYAEPRPGGVALVLDEVRHSPLLKPLFLLPQPFEDAAGECG